MFLATNIASSATSIGPPTSLFLEDDEITYLYWTPNITLVEDGEMTHMAYTFTNTYNVPVRYNIGPAILTFTISPDHDPPPNHEEEFTVAFEQDFSLRGNLATDDTLDIPIIITTGPGNECPPDCGSEIDDIAIPIDIANRFTLKHLDTVYVVRNVTITDVAEPTPLALLTIGFAIMATRRRKSARQPGRSGNGFIVARHF